MDSFPMGGDAPGSKFMAIWYWEFLLRHSSGSDVVRTLHNNFQPELPEGVQRLAQMCVARLLTNMVEQCDCFIDLPEAITWVQYLGNHLVDGGHALDEVHLWGSGLSQLPLEKGQLDPHVDILLGLLLSLEADGSTRERDEQARSLLSDFLGIVWELFGPSAVERMMCDAAGRGGMTTLARGAGRTSELEKLDQALQEAREEHANLRKVLEEQKRIYEMVRVGLTSKRGGLNAVAQKVLQRAESMSLPSSSQSHQRPQSRHEFASPEYTSKKAGGEDCVKKLRFAGGPAWEEEDGDDTVIVEKDMPTDGADGAGAWRTKLEADEVKATKGRAKTREDMFAQLGKQAKKKPRLPFTEKDDRTLIQGLEEFGKHDFQAIRDKFAITFAGRTGKELQERAMTAAEGTPLSNMWRSLK